MRRPADRAMATRGSALINHNPVKYRPTCFEKSRPGKGKLADRPLQAERPDLNPHVVRCTRMAQCREGIMSAPVRGPHDGPSKDGPLRYAPKHVRHPQRDLIPVGPPRGCDAALQYAALELGRTPWKRAWEGDAPPRYAAPESALAPWKQARKGGAPQNAAPESAQAPWKRQWRHR